MKNIKLIIRKEKSKLTVRSWEPDKQKTFEHANDHTGPLCDKRVRKQLLVLIFQI